MRSKIVSGIAVLAMTMLSHGVTNTWTGAVDGNWSNTANWDVNGIPADNFTSDGLTMNEGDLVVFDGAAPIRNVPGLGGSWANGAANTPVMQFNSGGIFNFSMVGNQQGSIIKNYTGTTTIWTVGDGSGAADEVGLNISDLNLLTRHTVGVNNITVNSDGVLTFEDDIDFMYSTATDRYPTFTIHGGAVVVNGVATDLGAYEEAVVHFSTTNGSFTANFGGALTNLDQVVALPIWTSEDGVALEYSTNETSYTVSAIYSALTAEINVSTNSGLAALEVVFDGTGSSPSGDITAYNWDFGDGNVGSGSLATNTYASDGIFTATLTVLDASSNTVSKSVDITVMAPATEISLVADAVNSSEAFYGSDLAYLLTDTFDYDPLVPTATLPSLVFTDGFHGNDTNGFNALSFTLDSAYTTDSTFPLIGIDLWGRNSNQERDDNIDVILYNGDYATEVGRVEGVAIPDGAEPYARALINTIATGTTFDRIQIIGHHQAFTLTEVRLVAVWGELVGVIPEITATPTVGAPPMEVVFDGSASTVLNLPATYEWDFGNGNTDSGLVVTNTYAVDGVYTATLTITDSLGKSNSTTTVIEAFYMPENVVYSTSQSDFASPPSISDDDLAQTAFLSVTNTGVWVDERAYPETALFDGTVGSTGTWFHTDASVTITLDTAASTLGYDITAIDTVFGGNAGAGGRANQGYSVIVTYMDDSTEKILGKKTWEPNEPASYWTKVSFSNTVGEVMASGVKAITFAEMDPAGAAGHGDFSVGCEFDIFGVPTEPEGGVQVSVNGTTMEWNTPTVRGYDVEYRNSLVFGDWMFYTTVISTPPTTSFEMPVDEADVRFFQVKVGE